jgi:hypothetical protein
MSDANIDGDLHVGEGVAGPDGGAVVAQVIPRSASEAAVAQVDTVECSVCLEVVTFEDGAKCRQCKAMYHDECAKQFIKERPNCPMCRVKFPLVANDRIGVIGFYSAFKNKIINSLIFSMPVILKRLVVDHAQHVENLKTETMASDFFKDLERTQTNILEERLIAMFNRYINRHIVPSMRRSDHVLNRHEIIFRTSKNELRIAFRELLKNAFEKRVLELRSIRIQDLVDWKSEELIGQWRRSGFYQDFIGMIFERHKDYQQVVILHRFSWTSDFTRYLRDNNVKLYENIQKSEKFVHQMIEDFDNLNDMWLRNVGIERTFLSSLHSSVWKCKYDELHVSKAIDKVFSTDVVIKFFYDDLGERFAAHLCERKLDFIVDEIYGKLKLVKIGLCFEHIGMDVMFDYVYRQRELGETLPPADEFIDNFMQTCDLRCIYQTYFRVYVSKQVLSEVDARYALQDGDSEKIKMRVIQIGCDAFAARDEPADKLLLRIYLRRENRSWTNPQIYKTYFEENEEYQNFLGRRRDPAYVVGSCSDVAGYELARHVIERLLLDNERED